MPMPRLKTAEATRIIFFIKFSIISRAGMSDIMEQPPPELAVLLSYQCVIVGRRRMQVTSLQVIEVAA
jgi:hypothetical protein